MSLINKIFGTETPTLSSHEFSAILRLYFQGKTVLNKTRTDVETLLTSNNNGVSYTLTQGEKDQIDEFKTHYDDQPNTNAKQDYIDILESTMVLANHGLGVMISRAKFKEFNGLTTE